MEKQEEIKNHNEEETYEKRWNEYEKISEMMAQVDNELSDLQKEYNIPTSDGKKKVSPRLASTAATKVYGILTTGKFY